MSNGGRIIRDRQGEPYAEPDRINTRRLLTEAQARLDKTGRGGGRALGPYGPRDDAPGDPASEDGTKVSFDELSVEVQGLIVGGAASVIKVTPPGVVGSDGADFTSINAALQSINNNSISNPYVILLAPGVYNEAPFSMKEHVHICGGGSPQAVIVATTNQNAHFITHAPNSWLCNLSLEGPTNAGYATVYYATQANSPCFLKFVLFRKFYYGIWNDTPTGGGVGIVHAFFVGNWYSGTTSNQFFRATNHSNITAINCAAMSGPPGWLTDTVYYADGSEAEIYLDFCAARTSGALNGIYVDNGSYIKMVACSFTNGINALHIGPNGSNTRVDAVGCQIRDGRYTLDIWIESATAVVNFTGHADKAKIQETAGNTFSAFFADVTSGEEGTVNIGELWLGTGVEQIPLASYSRETFSTGAVSGGDVNRNAPPSLNVDVASGVGYVNTGTGVVRVVWSAVTALALPANSESWIWVDGAGVVQSSVAEPDEADDIILAVLETDATSVVFLAAHRVELSDNIPIQHNRHQETVGPIATDGNIVTENATPLRLDVTSGSYWLADEKFTTVATAPITFTYWYRDGSGGWTKQPGQTLVNVTLWDDSDGTLGTLTVDKYRRDILVLSHNADGTEYHLFYGQFEYDTQAAAEFGVDFMLPDHVTENALRVAAIIVGQGAASIAEIVDRRPFLGQYRPPERSLVDSSQTAFNRGYGLFKSNAAYLDTNSATYVPITEFTYPGTINQALPPDTFRGILATSAAGGSTMGIRLFDVTNALTIAELDPTASLDQTPTVVDVGVVANLPAAESIFEVQIKKVGTGNARIHYFNLYKA